MLQVARGMALHTSNAPLQSGGCQLLLLIVQQLRKEHRPVQGLVWGAAGALGAIIGALKAHSGTMEMQMTALRAAGELLGSGLNGELEQQFFEIVASSATEAMADHTSVAVHISCCELLHKLVPHHTAHIKQVAAGHSVRHH